MSEKYSKPLSIVTIVFAGAVIAQTVFSAVVVNPVCGPTSPTWPNCNTEPPVTVGPAAQTKIGSFVTQGGLGAVGDLLIGGDAAVIGGSYVGGGSGDMDGDGRIRANDITLLINCVNGSADATCAKADVNGDGFINALDSDILVGVIS